MRQHDPLHNIAKRAVGCKVIPTENRPVPLRWAVYFRLLRSKNVYGMIIIEIRTDGSPSSAQHLEWGIPPRCVTNGEVTLTGANLMSGLLLFSVDIGQ